MALLAAGIIAGISMLGKGISTYLANQNEGELANKLSEELEDQKLALEERASLMVDELEGLYSGDIPIPIERVDPEDAKMPQTAYEAIDDAVSDEAMKNYMDGADRALATQIASSSADPRLRAYASAKATQEYKQGVNKTASELAKDDAEVKMGVAAMEADINAKNAAAQNKADADYAAFKNQYLQQKENALQKFIMEAEDEGFDMGYQAMAMPLQQQVQAATNTGQFFDQAGAVGISAVAAGAEDGGRVSTLAEEGMKNYLGSYMDFSKSRTEQEGQSDLVRAMAQIQLDPREKPQEEEDEEKKDGESQNKISDFENDLDSGDTLREMGGRATRYLSRENGGHVDRTRGEFNHGPMDAPEEGNDQVLIDQEDLIAGLKSGAIQSYEDIAQSGMIQAITTGDELIFNNQQSSEIESRTINFAEEGAKTEGKKRSKKEIDAALRLADYMESLLAQPQFRK